MQKIGLYGGTFDPIHFGHINLAMELKDKKDLDEVWFIPAQINPHKTHIPPVSMKHRLAMLELAIEDIPSFKIKDIEAHRPPPSYTVDTIRLILEQEEHRSSSRQFFLLLGEDSIPGFFKWHQPEEIVKLVPLLIGSRTGHYIAAESDISPSIKSAIQQGMVKTRIMDISSTELRERLSKQSYCGHLIPARALNYVKKNQLYQLNDRI